MSTGKDNIVTLFIGLLSDPTKRFQAPRMVGGALHKSKMAAVKCLVEWRDGLITIPNGHGIIVTSP
jgi:hypothetical protein